MYEEIEMVISRKYLQKVITTVNEPIVILGGWAVYYQVNKAYYETTGREYIGSRDIDLGFSIPSTNPDDSAFFTTLKRLQDDLGFRPLSFRMFKEMHLETGEAMNLEEAKSTPSYMIFPLYIDMIVDNIPDGFTERYGFTPIDEPLLTHVFSDPKNRIEIEMFGKQLWLPSPEILLAMKIKSYPDRTKDHKKTKDISDIAALLLFSSIQRGEGILTEFLIREDLDRFKTTLNLEDIKRAAGIIGIDQTLIENPIRQSIK
ncbi:MAG: hypothetical protein R6U17_09320 [Thermoplasmata archaeon]